MRVVYKTPQFEVEIEMSEQEGVVFGGLIGRILATQAMEHKPNTGQEDILKSILAATKGTTKDKKTNEA